MDIIFISAVTLGAYALQGLIASDAYSNGNAVIKAIYSLDDTKASQTSGYQIFDDLAERVGAPLHKVRSIKADDVIAHIRKYDPDFIFIIGWSELAPSQLLDIPKIKHGAICRHSNYHGCIGIHPTLLPQGRGRAPIPWAIIKGLTKSGVTMFYLEEEADAGDIIAQREFDILLEDDATNVYAKVAGLHYELCRDILPLLTHGTASRRSQDPHHATVWPKRKPENGAIDWMKSSVEIYNWIRALTHPYPGAFTFWGKQKLTIWKACLDSHTNMAASPGTIIDTSDKGIRVACVDGSVILTQIQVQDGPIQEGNELFTRHVFFVGASFS